MAAPGPINFVTTLHLVEASERDIQVSWATAVIAHDDLEPLVLYLLVNDGEDEEQEQLFLQPVSTSSPPSLLALKGTSVPNVPPLFSLTKKSLVFII